MREDIRTAWVGALRSGDYAQTKEYLGIRDVDSNEVQYCCIGVLAEVCKVKLPELAVRSNMLFGSNEYKFIVDGEEHAAVAELPNPVLDHIGLTSGQQICLITMNDDEDQDFNQIANWIEENL